MPSSISLSSLCFASFLILIDHMATAQPRDFLYYNCVYDQGNYTADSPYKANLDRLLSTLTADHRVDYGFYNISYGQQHQANAIGLCRGDILPDACRSCLNDSTALLPTLCPNQTEANGWYDDCMLRYSDRILSGFMEPSPAFYSWQSSNASDQGRFTEVARNLLERLAGEAASGGSRLKFATGDTAAPNLPTIYGAVQCTPDLSERDCSDCLLDALTQIRRCCGGKIGGRIGRPSCNFRYEMYQFFQSTPPPPPDDSLLTNTTTDGQGNKVNKSLPVIIVVIAVIGVVVLTVLIISVCIFSRTTRPRRNAAKSPAEDEISSVESLLFDFDTIRIATNDFSEANKLGEGGFGAVYKGLFPNGQDIAVKRLTRVSSQGEDEFKNEVLLVAKLQHRNLVQLLGFSLKGNEKLLIYEFVQNSSLEKLIFDPLKRASLDWESRYKIIGGIVRGLVYLHEDSQLRIIHRDLKVSNILLDAEMNAKIADFGTAKLFQSNQTKGSTSRIMGTFGYMAPEYGMKGHFSVKSDVFSFGVLILEIVSGRKNNPADLESENAENLISYAWRNWRNGTALDIVDSCLSSCRGSSSSRAEMGRCIHVGLLCVQQNLGDRPIMSTVLLMLEDSCSITLPTPSQPAFLVNSTTTTHRVLSGQDDSSQPQSILDDMSFAELYPR